MRVIFHIPTWWHNWWYPRPHLSHTMISLSVLGCDFLQTTHSRSDSGSVSLVRSLNEDQLSVSSPNLIKHRSVTRSTYMSTPTKCTQKSLISKTVFSEYELVMLFHARWSEAVQSYSTSASTSKNYKSDPHKHACSVVSLISHHFQDFNESWLPILKLLFSAFRGYFPQNGNKPYDQLVGFPHSCYCADNSQLSPALPFIQQSFWASWNEMLFQSCNVLHASKKSVFS